MYRAEGTANFAAFLKSHGNKGFDCGGAYRISAPAPSHGLRYSPRYPKSACKLNICRWCFKKDNYTVKLTIRFIFIIKGTVRHAVIRDDLARRISLR
jgi:hypothetical protein